MKRMVPLITIAATRGEAGDAPREITGRPCLELAVTDPSAA